MRVKLNKENIKGVGVVSGVVELSGHSRDDVEIVMIDLVDSSGNEIDAQPIYEDIVSFHNHIVGMVQKEDLEDKLDPFNNTHDYTHLVYANIKWLTSYLALSETRIDGDKHHQEVRAVIKKLEKALTCRTDETMEDVRIAFEWLGKNIWKCWC